MQTIVIRKLPESLEKKNRSDIALTAMQGVIRLIVWTGSASPTTKE